MSAEREFAAKQLADGRLLASHLAATGSPALSSGRWLRRVCEVIGELLPSLRGTAFPTLVSSRSGTLATPDSQPIVGAVGPDEGLFVAAGFSGHGLPCSPPSGGVSPISRWDIAPDPDLAAFSLARFSGERPPGELQTV